ncbi:MAG: bis(5'-nucleosyl)-tetraphosphatase (symmetrical) YqeK [Clostridia bacterium]|nr:bis(5'-nucleosyl)-tetraphosphatase (symmetrical) YqeK [Clostridia bacterium]
MIKYEELYNDVKKVLSEKRFTHSEGVVKRAIEYAKIYNEDEDIVKLVAIAHDIAKEISEEETKKYLRKYEIELDDIEKQSKNLIHGIIGAQICKEKYNFTDDMINAVRYHTTGRENMSTLEKIIYLADATEENRKYCYEPYVELIKNDIDKGMCEVSKWVIGNLLDRNEIIHLDTVKCYNYYKTRN